MKPTAQDLHKAEKQAFLARLFGLALLCALALLALNTYLWTKSETEQAEPLQVDGSRFAPTYEDDFSVDKLNSQVSVKQLRQALWNEELSPPSPGSGANQRTRSELEADIARLSSEIEQLEK
ncbi:hypothetical protein ACNO5M_24530 [Vibrio owensii]|uniref:hypothetical protein n=1 Tax=Vibrio owensii TaxID=696485 RepID=UPI003AAA2643